MVQKGGSGSWGGSSWGSNKAWQQQQSWGNRNGATQAQDDMDDQPAAQKPTAEEVKEKLGDDRKSRPPAAVQPVPQIKPVPQVQ